jgi:hypothetical protein
MLPAEIETMLRNSVIPGGLGAQLRQAWGSLAGPDRVALVLLLRTATGAGLGALVAQFLQSRGLTAPLTGALAGGYLAYRTSPNRTGQAPSNTLPFWQL